ncbi:hypothetical protein FXO37_20694 [Capsicum annuum]|nr:hypothetical protein FXO37_20694 [Capsicum annuum]
MLNWVVFILLGYGEYVAQGRHLWLEQFLMRSLINLKGLVFLQILLKFQRGMIRKGPKHLPKKLLSQILRQQSLNIASSNEGMSSALRFKRVLIVLDDVDNDNQLKDVAGLVMGVGYHYNM